MKIDVLLATMFFEQESPDYLDQMNIETDIVIGNQCDYEKTEVLLHKGHRVTLLSRAERGVGRNRNLCLFSSEADIVLFADNDVQYYDGYAEKVERYYSEHPDADVVIFNFKVKRGEQPFRDINKQDKRAAFKDITRFGTIAVTARRERLLEKRITFSLLFGGGAKYSCGEDSLFLIDCFNRGLRIYLCSETLGQVIHRESTWFKGITEKFIYDKGVLFRIAFPKTYVISIFYHAWKHKKMYHEYGNFSQVFRLMLQGARAN